MSKILKSTTLGNVKNGGIFKALGKKFVKLDADEHGCLVLAKDIWTKMPFRDGDDPECPNDLRRSDVMKYLGNCLAEFTEKGTPLDTFIPFKIDLQDTTGQTEGQEQGAYAVSGQGMRHAASDPGSAAGADQTAGSGSGAEAV